MGDFSFSLTVQTASRAIQVGGLSRPGVKRLRCEVDHSPQSSARLRMSVAVSSVNHSPQSSAKLRMSVAVSSVNHSPLSSARLRMSVAVPLVNHSPLSSARLRMSVAVPSVPLYAFIAWTGKA